MRLLSILVSLNLRLGMPDRAAVDHARGMADLLAEHFAGESLYVGRQGSAARDAEVAALRAAGLSTRKIGRVLGMSRSAVHRSLARQGIVGVPVFPVTRDAGRAEPCAGPRTCADSA